MKKIINKRNRKITALISTLSFPPLLSLSLSLLSFFSVLPHFTLYHARTSWNQREMNLAWKRGGGRCGGDGEPRQNNGSVTKLVFILKGEQHSTPFLAFRLLPLFLVHSRGSRRHQRDGKTSLGGAE